MDKYWHAELRSNLIYLHKLENIINGNSHHLHIINKEIVKTWLKLTRMNFKIELNSNFTGHVPNFITNILKKLKQKIIKVV